MVASEKPQDTSARKLNTWSFATAFFHPLVLIGLISLDSSEKDENDKVNVTVQEEAARTPFIIIQTNC